LASTFSNITKIPELRNRILFTIAMLGVYRAGVFVTTPGVNRAEMGRIMGRSDGGFLGLFNLFTGGALEQVSVFALGVMPYITASIVLQLLNVVVPKLNELKQDSQGRKKLTQYTRYGTVLLSVIQGTAMAFFLENFNDQADGALLPWGNGHWGFRLLTMLSMTTGTAFLMWLGEQITERGIGTGMSLIITCGILAGFIPGVTRTLKSFSSGEIAALSGILLLIVVVGVVAFIAWVERAQRRIPVQYTRRAEGRKSYAGKTSYLPLKINTAGVIPPIFASSMMIFPSQLLSFFPESQLAQQISVAFSPNDWRYNVMFVLLIVFFCFFYTAVTFDPVEVADNMKRRGGFVPGIRAGKKTAEYIDYVLTRLTFGGALYVSAVCILPMLMQVYFNVPFYYGGTSLLIAVNVALDTVDQIEQHLITRHYEGISTTSRGASRIRERGGI
jgi:preprotein translocase subunit SecY